MPGIVGSLFSEFGFVLAFSVSISAAVALTVCRCSPPSSAPARKGMTPIRSWAASATGCRTSTWASSRSRCACAGSWC
ncbi:MAG: hypothetical protein WDN31_20900 [Hyphomicrobium sp.]